MAPQNNKGNPARFAFGNNTPGQTAPAEFLNPSPPVPQTAMEETEIVTTPILPPDVKPAGKIGRPKGVDKVKKTFYLTSGVDNLKAAQMELVKGAGLFIKDESEVADLALAVLAAAVKDPTRLENITQIYNQEIKK